MATWLNRATLSKYINLGEGLFFVSLFTQSTLSAGLIGCYLQGCDLNLTLSLFAVVGSVIFSTIYSMFAIFLSHNNRGVNKPLLSKGVSQLLAIISSAFWVGGILIAHDIGHIDELITPLHLVFAFIHYAALSIIISVTHNKRSKKSTQSAFITTDF